MCGCVCVGVCVCVCVCGTILVFLVIISLPVYEYVVILYNIIRLYTGLKFTEATMIWCVYPAPLFVTSYVAMVTTWYINCVCV